MMPETFTDPVVAEIHATRVAMLEAAGGDVHVLMRQVAERQRTSGRNVIRQPLRKRSIPNPTAVVPDADEQQ